MRAEFRVCSTNMILKYGVRYTKVSLRYRYEPINVNEALLIFWYYVDCRM